MSQQPYGPDPRNQPNPRQPLPGNQGGYGPPANNSLRSTEGDGAYAQSQYESYVDPAGNRIESQEEVFEDKNLSRANTRYWITTVTYFILAVIEVILLLRLIFRLLGANQDNGFITFLYGLSHIFVAAFNGIFNDQTLGSHGVFELSTLVAMLVYALLAWGVVSLGRVLFAPTLTGRQRSVTTRRSR
jgi:YGGT family